MKNGDYIIVTETDHLKPPAMKGYTPIVGKLYKVLTVLSVIEYPYWVEDDETQTFGWVKGVYPSSLYKELS